MAKYFDMNSFLAEQEALPVVFNSGCTGLGKEMDSQNDGHNLPLGAEVDLPFWLVPKLFEQNMVAPKMPDCFDSRAWMVIDAEPRNVPIREFCPHFFEFGARLNTLLRDDAFGEALERAFLARYRSLLVEAHSTSDVKWRRLLSKEEEALFDAGRESMKSFNTWKYATREKMEVAAQVRAQKRRRAGAAVGMIKGPGARGEKSSRRT
uniref:DNA replication complex GINS protein PSF3 N-terminal domain-containing protein n=1 Tax=Mantoniella antarctica TaxID=81844 RepID=A0A7S0S894_9CHLO|mmetsp:Transcript_13582/g.32785  ORF Transcript_13582/g.32785 Transcript_13582/m.32785 type:complete len:207 (+) Transcript_13582:87-707(+)